MNSPKDDGGPAFPIVAAPHLLAKQLSVKEYEKAVSGMSLRDWFAGMALQGIAYSATAVSIEAARNGLKCPVWDTSLWASQCYQVADAMLAERERRQL